MAVEVTGTAQREAWVADRLPPVERVRPGLWSIPVPIPANPLRYVLVYAFELPDGVAVVDAGWDTPEAWSALTAGLATTGHEVADVRAVLVTHIHPDHYGLAGKLRDRSGAWIALHPLEAATLPARYGAVDDLIAESVRWLLRSGATREEAVQMAGSSTELLPFVHMAEPDRLLEDGDLVPLPGWRLRALWTPGHTPGHLCFHDEANRLLLSGDHMLPRITANISAHPQQPPNPLAAYLRSLAAVAPLAADEVLPGHEYRFRGLRDRAEDLRSHHEDRLHEVRERVRERPGRTTWEVAGELTWSRPWEQVLHYMRRAAAGETLAHLVLLAERGLVRCDASGDVDRWYPAGPA